MTTVSSTLSPIRFGRFGFVSIVLSIAAVISACSASPNASGTNAVAPEAPTSIGHATPDPASDTAVPASTIRGLSDASPWPSDPGSSGPVKRWAVEVVGSIPHDSGAYTQGLELADGVLYESDGLYGESSIRTVDPISGAVLSKVDIDPAVFGEGLTVVGSEIVQITWREGRAIRHDRSTLAPIGEFSYDGEGWGLCLMDDHLLMTDGSEHLTSRDPSDFSVTSVVSVTIEGQPVTYLNELECIGDLVVANIYTTTDLVVIDPADGRVVATIDASVLLGRVEGRIGTDPGNVLNGVADMGNGTLMMAGKRWPESFVVRLIES